MIIIISSDEVLLSETQRDFG